MKDKLSLENILKLFDQNNNITLIATNDLCFEIVEELELRGHKFNEEDGFTMEDVEELYDTPVLRVTKSNYEGETTYWFEVAYGLSHIKFVEENEFALIERGILSTIEKLNYVLGGYHEFVLDESVADKDTECFLEDMTCELLDGISELGEDDCFHCYIKKYLKEIYDIGYNDANIDML